MAESLQIAASASKKEKYEELLPQLKSLVSVETDRIANLANVAAALRQTMGFFWVGFYLDSGKDLVLGPFQGPIACTRIPYSRGVCGSSFSKKETILVEDVDSLNLNIFQESENIGITASASSPEVLVKKLLDNLKRNFEININIYSTSI